MEVNEIERVKADDLYNDVRSEKITLSKIEIEDRGGFVWGIIGFLSPILGLFLHLIMRKTLPRNAGALKVGVIVSFVMIAVLAVLYLLILLITVVWSIPV